MAGLDAYLKNIPVPSGTEFPGTVDQLLALIAQYEKIFGLENFNGVNYGPSEPQPETRNMPWYRTDDSGNPLGWHNWNGLAWVLSPTYIDIGKDRPLNPKDGQQFFDTDIEVMLVYYNSKWITLAGSPGDVKEVKHLTIEDALKYNPGWVLDEDSIGHVIGGANPDHDSETDEKGNYTPGILRGEEMHTLEGEETGIITFKGILDDGDTHVGNYKSITAFTANDKRVGAKDATGNLEAPVDVTADRHTPHNNMQQTRFYIRLVKE